MSSIVSLPGSAALSAFRLDKIRQEAARLGIGLGDLSARFWHFLELDGDLDAAAARQIDSTLDYGTPTDSPVAEDVHLLVTPRPGTANKWGQNKWGQTRYSQGLAARPLSPREPSDTHSLIPNVNVVSDHLSVPFICALALLKY